MAKSLKLDSFVIQESKYHDGLRGCRDLLNRWRLVVTGSSWRLELGLEKWRAVPPSDLSSGTIFAVFYR